MNQIVSWIVAATLICPGAMADAQERHGVPPAAARVCGDLAAGWSVPDGERTRTTSATEILTAMAARDVVLLGEFHDEDDHHLWQVQTLAALHFLRPTMVIGFEMFPRRVQPVLDRWVAGKLTVKQFLAQSEWDKIWSVPAELYLPLFQFARLNRIPMVALNIDQKLSKTIAEKGWDAVPEANREGVGRAAPPAGAYLDLLLRSYRAHPDMHGDNHVQALKTSAAFLHFVDSQLAWDRAMAEAIARHVPARTTGGKPLVVGIMGSGHIRFGYGVPHQLHDLGVKNVGTLIPLHADADCGQIRAGLSDAVFALPIPARAKPEPPRLGVLLEDSDGGVRIAQVTAGSLAESTGLKPGDRLLAVGGVPMKSIGAVIASVRRQPGGSWLPLRVQRANATLELVAKFPPEP